MPSVAVTMSRLLLKGKCRDCDVLYRCMDLRPFVRTIRRRQYAEVVPLKLWDSEQVGELYVHLLCRFEAREALPFLQSHDNYRVEVVLPFTQKVCAPPYPLQPDVQECFARKDLGGRGIHFRVLDLTLIVTQGSVEPYHVQGGSSGHYASSETC
jgi:hypothetical protein